MGTQPLFQILARSRAGLKSTPPDVSRQSGLALGYELLSVGLLPPDAPALRTLREHLTPVLLRKALEGADLPGHLGERFFRTSTAELACSYRHLFGDHGRALREPRRPGSSGEGGVRDLLDRYRRTGFEPPAVPRLDPDHASVELAFAQRLVLEEMEDLLEGRASEPRRMLRKSFVRDHLAGWLPRLAEAVAPAGDAFHPALLRAAADFVESDAPSP